MSKNIFKRIHRKMKAVHLEKYFKYFVEHNYIPTLEDIFDYHTALQKRPDTFFEQGWTNYRMKGYGIGATYRNYCGYTGEINSDVEHSLAFNRTNNEIEYRDGIYPVVLSSSSFRRDFIQPLTDKLIIPAGPFYIPYAKSIYDDFTLECIKKNIGKTLLVYPQHNNVNSFYEGEEEKITAFIDYVNNIKEQYHYDTVICCVYFADILNQTYLKYEKLGWKIVTAGRNENRDFGNNAKTILSLADYVIAQGSMASIVQAVYMKIPSTYVLGRQQKRMSSGVLDTPGETLGHTELYHECAEIFEGYSETISQEQYDWCNKWGGFDDVKSPEELALIFDFASALKKRCTKEKCLKLLNKPKYASIKPMLMESVNLMK